MALAGPPAARGTIEVTIETRPPDWVDLVSAELDGRPLPAESPARIDTASLPDGEHTLTVRARDRSWRRNEAAASLRFSSDNTPPSLTVQSSPSSVAQGHTLVVTIHPSEPADVQAALDGRPLRVFTNGGDSWAVAGVDADEPPGTKVLVVDGKDRLGNSSRTEARISVLPFTFTRYALQVPPSMQDLLDPAVRTAEDERLGQIYHRENGPPLWRGPFLLPVDGPISTEFGEVRSYNGGPFQGHHGGTDFEAGLGTPVQAPARGRVVAREQLRLRGNTLVLDHGGGVYTTYAHLSEFLVDMGQEVQAGQPIAKVGNTGLSTGPHLHWELWVGGKAVDPVEWTKREVP